MKPHRLIASADDLGLTRGVVDGIIATHEQGIITSSSAMVNMPEIAYAAKRCAAYSSLDVGIHLTFTAGSPISRADHVATLVDASGRFMSQRELFNKREHVSLAELKRELEAQIERFSDIFGLLPSHVTCHHFVHLWSPFFRVYVDVAEAFNLPFRNPINRYHVAGLAAVDSLVPGASSATFRRSMTRNTSRLEASRVLFPDYFLDQFSGVGKPRLDVLMRLLENLPSGTSELLCHPGYVDDGLIATSSYSFERQIEVEILTDPSVKKCVRESQIELVSFGDLRK